jgi:hypothetical protein
LLALRRIMDSACFFSEALPLVSLSILEQETNLQSAIVKTLIR